MREQRIQVESKMAREIEKEGERARGLVRARERNRLRKCERVRERE